MKLHHWFCYFPVYYCEAALKQSVLYKALLYINKGKIKLNLTYTNYNKLLSTTTNKHPATTIKILSKSVKALLNQHCPLVVTVLSEDSFLRKIKFTFKGLFRTVFHRPCFFLPWSLQDQCFSNRGPGPTRVPEQTSKGPLLNFLNKTIRVKIS